MVVGIKRGGFKLYISSIGADGCELVRQLTRAPQLGGRRSIGSIVETRLI